MKKWTGKRVLSVLLALTMCLSMGTMQVQAETGSPGIEVKNSTQTTGLDFSDDSVDAEAITSYIENNAYRDRYDDWWIELVITLPETMGSEEAWANLRKGIMEAEIQDAGIYVDLTLKGIETIPSGQDGEGVFHGLTRLNSVVLPSVTSLGSYTFSGCDNLDKITFGSPLSIVEVNGFSCGREQYVTLTLSSGQKAMNPKLYGETLVGWVADDQASAFGTNEFCGETFRKIQCPHDRVELISFEVNGVDVFQHIKTCAHCETTVIEDHTPNEDGVCTGCGDTTSHLYVGGIPVTGANADDVLGDDDVGATVRYDVSTNTLTLENAVIQGVETVRGAGIYATGNDTLVLQLEGANQVAGTYSDDWHVDAGVYTDGKLQIQGSGALTTTSKIASGTEEAGVPEISAGIFARGGMSMISGTLHAFGGGATSISSGIYAFYYDGYEVMETKSELVSIAGGTATLESGEIYTVTSGILESEGKDQHAVMGTLDLSGYPYVKWTQTEDGDPCVVPFNADGMMTGYLHMEPGDYRIAPQPAAENGYTVEAQVWKETDWGEITDPISYQWYQSIQKQVVLDPTEADQVGGLTFGEFGTYSEEGYWEPAHFEGEGYAMEMAIPAEAGDWITVTMRENTEAVIILISNNEYVKAIAPGYAFEVHEKMLVEVGDTDEGAPKYVLFLMMDEDDFGVQVTLTSSEEVSSTATAPNRFNSTTPGNYYGRVIVASAEGDGVAAIMDSQPFFFVPVYTITFDAGVGQCDTVSKDTEMGTGKFEASYELPVAVSEDYTFLGWVTEEGNPVTEETVFEKNTTVKAKWAVKVNQAPVAKEGLTYTGGAQELITAGTAGKNGVMMYSLSKDGSYDTAIPVGTGVGSYTVWYYVAALDGSGFEDSEALAVSVGIGKAVGSATVTMDGWVYKDSPADPVSVSTTNGTDNVTYLYESTDGKGYSSAIVPVDAGAYKVTATFAENDLYLSCEAEATFTISPKSIVGAQILLDAEKLVYTGQELEQIVQSVTVGDLNVD
ncbi:MAG: leucine-rich repeat protein, partial [Lachnospiraceae bacterium]|nr:leucine-rich repeat protein [Lachnospiraceae bacterium]